MPTPDEGDVPADAFADNRFEENEPQLDDSSSDSGHGDGSGDSAPSGN